MFLGSFVGVVCVMVSTTERKAKGEDWEMEFFLFFFFYCYFTLFYRLFCNDV